MQPDRERFFVRLETYGILYQAGVPPVAIEKFFGSTQDPLAGVLRDIKASDRGGKWAQEQTAAALSGAGASIAALGALAGPGAIVTTAIGLVLNVVSAILRGVAKQACDSEYCTTANPAPTSYAKRAIIGLSPPPGAHKFENTYNRGCGFSYMGSAGSPTCYVRTGALLDRFHDGLLYVPEGVTAPEGVLSAKTGTVIGCPGIALRSGPARNKYCERRWMQSPLFPRWPGMPEKLLVRPEGGDIEASWRTCSDRTWETIPNHMRNRMWRVTAILHYLYSKGDYADLSCMERLIVNAQQTKPAYYVCRHGVDCQEPEVGDLVSNASRRVWVHPSHYTTAESYRRGSRFYASIVCMMRAFWEMANQIGLSRSADVLAAFPRFARQDDWKAAVSALRKKASGATLEKWKGIPDGDPEFPFWGVTRHFRLISLPSALLALSNEMERLAASGELPQAQGIRRVALTSGQTRLISLARKGPITRDPSEAPAGPTTDRFIKELRPEGEGWGTKEWAMLAGGLAGLGGLAWLISRDREG